MFGGRNKGAKAPPRGKGKRGGGLSQFGLMDIPDINLDGGMDDGDDSDGNDSDLEAELLALQQDSGVSRPRARPKPRQVAPQALDNMIKESLRDIPSDEDVDVDENDPDLLAELSSLSGPPPPPVRAAPVQPTTQSVDVVSLLNERITMYKQAEASAKSAGEPAKARRCNRGLKTLQDLLRKAKAGRPISEEDIPPPVATTTTRAETSGSSLGVVDPNTGLPPSKSEVNLNTGQSLEPPEEPSAGMRPAASESNLVKPMSDIFLPTSTRSASPPPPTIQKQPEEKSPELKLLYARRDEYKQEALKAKRKGDTATALNHVKAVKQFDAVIKAVESGEEVDLSGMPPSLVESAPRTSISHQVAMSQVATPEPQPPSKEEKGNSEDPPMPDAPVPTTVKEALEQRMSKWQEQEQKAKGEGNSSKARRLGRIVKQYKDAIRSHQAGKTVDFSELPAPFGYPPIPGFAQAPLEIPKLDDEKEDGSEKASSGQEDQSSAGETSGAAAIGGATVGGSTTTQPKRAAPPPPDQKIKRQQSTRATKQQQELEQMQREFKVAAINAKKAKDLERAKEYLRAAKGFDKLIQVSKCGLPVDMSSLPVPPKAAVEEGFEIINSEDCQPEGEASDIFKKLQEDLVRQVQICTRNRDHYRLVGDVPSANRFDQLASHTKKDLDTVRFAYKHDKRLPKFHYEIKQISVVRCCTDLNDNDLELHILRGINYNVPNPKEVDTYIKYELPIPTDDPQRGKTGQVKDTNNPVYNHVVRLEINRKSRSLPRLFKRHSIKLEVWSKGGFFRGDSMIGTANVKLEPLEAKCELHNSFDLLEGRKKAGGQLEVKVRLRSPIVSKEVETTKEKWLVIDQM